MKALDIGKFTQICLDIESEQDKQGNFGNALFAGELRKFISSFPPIEAVPLEPLAKWIVENLDPRIDCKSCAENPENFECQCRSCPSMGEKQVREALTKWMEEQDAAD